MTNPFFITTIKRTAGQTGTAMVYVPKNILKTLNLSLGDKVIITIKHANDTDILCQCLDCGKISISENIDIFCKKCKSKNLKIISEDAEGVIKRGLQK